MSTRRPPSRGNPVNLESEMKGERLKEEMKKLGRSVSANVAGRVNTAKAVNVGSEGAGRTVSSIQRVRIRQNGRETIEESETIETNVESED